MLFLCNLSRFYGEKRLSDLLFRKKAESALFESRRPFLLSNGFIFPCLFPANIPPFRATTPRGHTKRDWVEGLGCLKRERTTGCKQSMRESRNDASHARLFSMRSSFSWPLPFWECAPRIFCLLFPSICANRKTRPCGSPSPACPPRDQRDKRHLNPPIWGNPWWWERWGRRRLLVFGRGVLQEQGGRISLRGSRKR